MEDLGSMTLAETFARRDATEESVASAIGRLVLAYARLNSALHYCVAWHNDGAELDSYGNRAEDLSVAELISKTDAQAKSRYGSTSDAYLQYRTWASKAHATRELRNLIMHSRWGIESFGRHAIAISTPPFVEPMREHVISTEELEAARRTCIDLASELGKLRDKYPL